MTQPVRVGLLGAGYIADWHAQALRSVPGVRLAAVCDRDRPRAEQLADRFGVPAFDSAAAMLEAGVIDSAHVLLPPPAHGPAALELLLGGVHAYLEKPMCLRPAECDDVLSAARYAGRAVGVGHNFLFDPVYERLKADADAGALGRLEHVQITWAKEFGPARGGPFGAWFLRDPAGVLLEVGPHSVAHLLDLVGPPDRLEAEAEDATLLPCGKFYRRWSARAWRGRTRADLRWSFDAGFPEHVIHVRGTAGTATADFERGTYVLRRHTGLAEDFDRYRRAAREAEAIKSQARGRLVRYALSKAKLARDGNAFGASVARAVRRFYADLPAVRDRRLTGEFGAEVVRTCHRVAKLAGFDADEGERRGSPPPSEVAKTAGTSPAARRAEALVLGGTGFIGRALVRRLAESGTAVRLLARDPSAIPDALRVLPVEPARGDFTRADDLARALEGVRVVYHLARSQSRTWDEYQTRDTAPTRTLAEACTRAGARLVFTGTTDSYYSGRDEVITEATPLDPKIHRRNLYAQAKAACERALADVPGLRYVVLRPAVVVGPGGDPHHWGVGMWPTPSVCLLWGSGDNPSPLVLADDVADALARAGVTEGVDGEAFNLAAEPCLAPREYVEELGKALGTRIDARPTPVWRFFAGDAVKYAVKVAVRHPGRRLPSYRDWRSRTYAARFDCSKARRLLGWNPAGDRDAVVEEGIRKPAAEWSA